MAIHLSSSAAERVRHFLERDGGAALRLAVKQTGCSGWAYVVNLADSPEADDIIFSDQGVTVVVDPKSLPFLDGSRIDFVNEGLGSTFKFENPNATEECGCGESFTIRPSSA